MLFAVRRERRFSQAISEGDGISLIVEVADAEAARDAPTHGAEGLALTRPVELGDTALPVLWRGSSALDDAAHAGADACVLVAARLLDDGERLEEEYGRAAALGLDCVVEVQTEEQVRDVLERVDAEIFLLAGGTADRGEGPLEPAFRLLPDVPAGKLALAEVERASAAQIAELERAGIDGVIVDAHTLAELDLRPAED